MRIALFDRPKGDHPFAALVMILIGVMVLALQDATVKFMADETSFWQLQSLRALGNGFLLLVICMVAGGFQLLRPIRPAVVYLRGSVMALCMFCFFGAAPYLSIAQMAMGLYTYPLFVSLLAGPVLGETVGRWRILAVLMGASGMMIILRPWTDDFSALQLLPVCAGFLYAVNVLIVRRLCRGESPVALAFPVAVIFFLSGMFGIILLTLFPFGADVQQAMPFVAIGWPPLTEIVIWFVIAASVMNLTGNILLIRAYQTADSSWLAPLDFSYLLFAAIWSKVIFEAWPTPNALVGMALIALAGILTAWREQVKKS